LGDIFQKKNAPNAKKYRPNGEISPNLVTLLATAGANPAPNCARHSAIKDGILDNLLALKSSCPS
jgi:hypothetical protein